MTEEQITDGLMAGFEAVGKPFYVTQPGDPDAIRLATAIRAALAATADRMARAMMPAPAPSGLSESDRARLESLPGRVRGLLSRITPGEWSYCDYPNGAWDIHAESRDVVIATRNEWNHRADESRANGLLFYESRAMLSDLLAELDHVLRLLDDTLGRERELAADKAHAELQRDMAEAELYGRETQIRAVCEAANPALETAWQAFSMWKEERETQAESKLWAADADRIQRLEDAIAALARESARGIPEPSEEEIVAFVRPIAEQHLAPVGDAWHPFNHHWFRHGLAFARAHVGQATVPVITEEDVRDAAVDTSDVEGINYEAVAVNLNLLIAHKMQARLEGDAR